jgi:hypothetical protein
MQQEEGLQISIFFDFRNDLWYIRFGDSDIIQYLLVKSGLWFFIKVFV